MMNRINSKFKELRRLKKKALIVYLTCGFPDLATTERLVLEIERKGADIIELGVPFSDPLADGPTIQAASEYALRKKINLNDILSLVRRLRRKTQIPICLMGYYNPVFSYGEDRFLRAAGKSGVDGIIIPDLLPGGAAGLISAAKKAHIATVFFLSPTSAVERVKLVDKVTSGFIYYVSLTGVTGARQGLSVDLSRNIKMIKRVTSKPVCVGFGISKTQQVSRVFGLAEGAIIGSAVIKIIQDNIGKRSLVEKVGSFVAGLRRGESSKNV